MNLLHSLRLSTTPARLCAALAVLALGYAQEHGLERARERWNDMPEARRRELVARYERWRSMPEEERARMRERFDHYDSVRRGAHEALSEKSRREFQNLGPDKQREVLHGVACEQISERGSRMLDMMPREWRERLDRASPDERAAVLDEFKRAMHARGLRRVDELERDGELGADEAARMRLLEPSELGPALLAQFARGFREKIEREGPPAYVTPEQWAEWKELPAPELFRRFHDARHSCEGRGERDGRRAEGSEPGERAEPTGPRAEALERIKQSMHPDPAWFVELAEMSREQRFENIGARIRERVLAELERSPELVDAAALAELRPLEGRKFLDALHRAVPDLYMPWMMRSERWHGGGEGWRGGEGEGRRSGEGKPPRRSGSGPRGPGQGAAPRGRDGAQQ